MEAAIAIAYKKGSSLSCLAMKYDCSIARIRKTVVERGGKIRPQKKPPEYIPTEEELRKRTEAVQDGWDERTRKARDCYKQKPVGVTVVPTSQHSYRKSTVDV